MTISSVGRAFRPVGRFFASISDTIVSAQKAQEIMSMPDSHFKKNGTTRDQAMRRLMNL